MTNPTCLFGYSIVGKAHITNLSCLMGTDKLTFFSSKSGYLVLRINSK